MNIKSVLQFGEEVFEAENNGNRCENWGRQKVYRAPQDWDDKKRRTSIYGKNRPYEQQTYSQKKIYNYFAIITNDEKFRDKRGVREIQS